ncbi:HAD family hydrolase [Paenibacillus taichungensis]|uniref:HAD family hydrolase n=1 Tax=Paenibacillus taichungensis TaxID=484184 RepID=UPI0039A5FF8A
MAKIRAVIFDLYETLITEYSNESRKVSRISRDYQELIGLSNKEFSKEWNNRQEIRMTGAFPDYFSVIKDIIEKQSLIYEDKVIRALYRERVHEKSVPFLDILQEIIELLEVLRKKDIKLGLISNCTEEEVQSWKYSELAQYLDEVIFSYQVGFAKPDNRIYELVCSRLGITANECIFVGDGGSNELDGASRNVMNAYHATWFIPEFISSRITDYKKLKKPIDLFKELETYEI